MANALRRPLTINKWWHVKGEGGAVRADKAKMGGAGSVSDIKQKKEFLVWRICGDEGIKCCFYNDWMLKNRFYKFVVNNNGATSGLYSSVCRVFCFYQRMHTLSATS